MEMDYKLQSEIVSAQCLFYVDYKEDVLKTDVLWNSTEEVCITEINITNKCNDVK